jgi:EpsI family protein
VKFYCAVFGAGDSGGHRIGGTGSFQAVPTTAERWNHVTIGDRSFQVRESTLQLQRSTMVVWSWYWIDGQFTSSDYMAKFLIARAALRGRSPVSATIMIAVEDLSDRNPSAVLNDFAEHLQLTSVARSGR